MPVCSLTLSPSAALTRLAEFIGLAVYLLLMMTGAVLAATEAVAVAVLLNELGAPARLEVRAAVPARG